MGNQFVNLPAPVGNGAGAAVDVSTFGALKTIVCGGDARAQITIEFNNDAAQLGSWVALASFQNTGQATLRVAARWMRMRVSGYNPYVGGTPIVDVGGTDDGSLFASIAAPAGNGVAAATDVSALGLYKTVQVGGDFRGTVIVEVSEDGGVTWAQPFSFNAQAGFQSAVIAADFMRVRRVGVPQVAPGLPVVNVGATSDFSGDDGVAISAGSQSVATGTVAFANSNGVSFGMSGSSRVTASVDAFRSVVGPGSTATGPTLSFANSNNVSFGVSGQTVTASAAAAGGAAISAGSQSVSTGTVSFANSNGVTFGMSGSNTITASFSAPPAETPFGISAGTQSVSTGTVSFANSNGVTFGMSGSNTITASIAAAATYSEFVPYGAFSKVNVGFEASTIRFQMLRTPNLTWNAIGLMHHFSGNAGSVGTLTLSRHFGVYTRNVSTLSLLMSTSLSFTVNHSQAANAAINNGMRMATTGWSSSLTEGNYFYANVDFSSVSSDNLLISQILVNASLASNFNGLIGQNTSAVSNRSAMDAFGFGYVSFSSVALPNSVALSDIHAFDSNVRRPPYFQLVVTA